MRLNHCCRGSVARDRPTACVYGPKKVVQGEECDFKVVVHREEDLAAVTKIYSGENCVPNENGQTVECQRDMRITVVADIPDAGELKLLSDINSEHLWDGGIAKFRFKVLVQPGATPRAAEATFCVIVEDTEESTQCTLTAKFDVVTMDAPADEDPEEQEAPPRATI